MNYIDSNILFVGPYSKKPKGGVAFVLSEYEKLFPDAYFLTSTVSKNRLTKVFSFMGGVIRFVYLLLTQPGIKIVHIHGASYKSFKRKYIFFRIAKWFNKKVIYHIHGGGYQLFFQNASPKIKQRIRHFINNSDCLICLSESWKTFFTQNFQPQNIVIIPNIIPLPIRVNVPFKSKNCFVKFLFLGLIDNNKGVWFLLEVLHEHKRELLHKAIFYIGGNGQTKELERKIAEYDLGEMVKFIGWIDGEEKQKQLSNADIYILPSYNEGLPISILEAMSYSLPILSTTVGGIPEIVSNENGRLITPGNKEQLWSAIEFFINADKITLAKMGQVSKLKANPHLPDEVQDKLYSLYNGILK